MTAEIQSTTLDKILPKAVRPSIFCKMYGISRCTAWRALKSGKLRSVTIGRRKLILLDSVKPDPI